ncbi:kinesin family protein-like protein [Boeremia exigua]|uniref:kinesin family protein-like protein n=1 Tax=Boeremia exigua TaxID=749465 RepID=UPI001E8E5540|nr:kinesin family protein-like protein [Boeremia exigua]KAH6615289.1 kinesin family protein-like protein [Boeremia exigua]
MESPPTSPAARGKRPASAMIRPNRSSSRLSMSSKMGGSRASDDDTKTAVKVAVRVRPQLKQEDPGYDLIPQRFRSARCHVTSPSSLAVDPAAGGRKVFVFDRVFSEDVDQEGVFEYVTESVNSFIEGYNVSILAYGQSGAGKSYTMGTTGPSDQNNPQVMGIIPRAAALLYETLEGPSIRPPGSGIRPPNSRVSSMGSVNFSSKSSTKKNWQLTATYVEIYNEQLRDLLLPDTVPHAQRPEVAIREEPGGRIILAGLTQVTINSVDDLLNALNFGSSIRQTDATAQNAKSSRSHAVFSLNLVQKKTSSTPTAKHDKRRSVPLEAMSGSGESLVTIDSKLHFVDLAGSERLKNTQASGERAREGISINAGLASLGKVISQLSSRHHNAHISYRDSRLTRLLQDSLGGNAITYMIACINPAEFHLSESLNTVQYAQRARAIQIKPQIQQIHDDSDKQATIERLRNEVQFLRDQMRLSQNTSRTNPDPSERASQQYEREMELQNQLLDFQENYTALSLRHSKLIAEISRVRDDDAADTPILRGTVGDTALERLKRSNSFADAVEDVVLEYEKTIQALESSLSNTRTSMSGQESELLEREARISLLESHNHQLQSRMQKAMERDASNEEYVKSLERQIDNSVTGVERTDTTITDLRDKLQKARENESSCEDYISTLEERLAENEQEVEVMTREIERLKHVVERQRSIGKLDNLLYELDTVRQLDAKPEEVSTNGHSRGPSDPFIEKRVSGGGQFTLEGARHFSSTVDAIAEEDDSERPTTAGATSGKSELAVQEDGRSIRSISVQGLAADGGLEEPSSPAQSRFVHDKLDSVTQELFDLRVEHEGTLQDYEKLASKYQEALRTLASLQDTVDEARHGSSRSSTFLGNVATNDLNKELEQSLSSRALSSELLSAESGNDTTPEDATEADVRRPSIASTDSGTSVPKALLVQELQALKLLHGEKEERVAELKRDYSDLQEQHQDALDYVEELKSEVTRAHLTARPSSPSVHMIRRKSSQALLSNDRSNRAVNSLRNLALDKLDEEPGLAFENNLSTILSELNTRSERVQELESEVASVRKEMEGKMTLISGLTKERSSLKASTPLDISIVATMQDQIKQNEEQMQELKNLHAQRESALREQVALLTASARSPESSSEAPSSRELPDAAEGDAVATDNETRHRQLISLSNEAAQWQSKHLEAIEATKASEKQHLSTVRELESAMEQLQANHTARLTELEDAKGVEASAALEQERTRHAELVAALQNQVDEHKATAGSNAARLAELEHSHANIIKQVEEDSEARALTEKELDTHKSLVANLEHQIEEHKSAIEYHQQGMDSLQKSHAAELEKLTSELTTHQESNTILQTDLSKAKNDLETLLRGVASALNQEVEVDQVQSQVEALVEARKSLTARMDQALDDLEAAKVELLESKTMTQTLRDNMKEFETLNAETIKELERVSDKERKSSRLVQELEDQLNQNWDQHEAANNRLSALQTERSREFQDVVVHREQLEKDLEDSRAKIVLLESQVAAKRNSARMSMDPREDLQRSDSNNSNGRKSLNMSLPSPPPAIPLPPLPPNSPPPHQTHAPSPPSSRHQSKDIAHAQLVEDQEARIRTIEKHLFAEKQLTATLEDALTDLESSSQKTKGDLDQYRKKCASLEEEINAMRKERVATRHSLQAVEEERNARLRVEAERAHLEARMAALNDANKKNKKKGTLNCF